MTKPLLEICCANAASCENAAALGVERIELCTALELGGISPNAALIAHAVSLELNTMVLIRPRSGDFYFSAQEQLLMLQEIEHALAMGAAGVVIGGLKNERLDLEFLREAKKQFPQARMTVHRAIDESKDYEADLQAIIDLNYERVLTSGQKTTAPEAAVFLGEMQAKYPSITLLAGGGVRASNVLELLNQGIREVHFSASLNETRHQQKLFSPNYAISDRQLIQEMKVLLEAYSKR